MRVDGYGFTLRKTAVTLSGSETRFLSMIRAIVEQFCELRNADKSRLMGWWSLALATWEMEPMAELECRVEILKFVWDNTYMTSDIRCGREGGENCNNIS